MANEGIRVIIDRPLGSRHPQHPDMVYPVNYGYVPGAFAGDGEEQDAYVLGIDHPLDSFTGRLVAVIHRKNDVEDKWVLAPASWRGTAEDIRLATAFQEQFFDGEIIMTER